MVAVLVAQVAKAVGRLEAPAAVTQAWRPVTVVGAEQLTAVVKFWLTKQDAVLRTLVPTAQVAYAAGRFEVPATALQAWRPATVTGAEQLTAVVKFKLTKQDAVLRLVVPAAHVAYAAGRVETPAAATQAWRPVTVVGAEQLTGVDKF